jgi:hypothetical protein
LKRLIEAANWALFLNLNRGLGRAKRERTVGVGIRRRRRSSGRGEAQRNGGGAFDERQVACVRRREAPYHIHRRLCDVCKEGGGESETARERWRGRRRGRDGEGDTVREIR